ncbi:hypothetical protein Nepgr_019252 [Nepenthes gracilis]|uniref:Uncharacterized protein n=1 Tax=Nepenthes gracilis TaxID=150966 RepID=A0AAD3SUX2_NEPGR|nr:hypothetical protein Nepgr_019252 [Nepenthes gracilis]
MSLCLSALTTTLDTLSACTQKNRVRNGKSKDKAGNRIYTFQILRASLSGLTPSSDPEGGEPGRGPMSAGLAATSAMNSAIGSSGVSSVLADSFGMVGGSKIGSCCSTRIITTGDPTDGSYNPGASMDGSRVDPDGASWARTTPLLNLTS